MCSSTDRSVLVLEMLKCCTAPRYKKNIRAEPRLLGGSLLCQERRDFYPLKTRTFWRRLVMYLTVTLLPSRTGIFGGSHRPQNDDPRSVSRLGLFENHLFSRYPSHIGNIFHDESALSEGTTINTPPRHEDCGRTFSSDTTTSSDTTLRLTTVLFNSALVETYTCTPHWSKTCPIPVHLKQPLLALLLLALTYTFSTRRPQPYTNNASTTYSPIIHQQCWSPTTNTSSSVKSAKTLAKIPSFSTNHSLLLQYRNEFRESMICCQATWHRKKSTVPQADDE